MTAVLQERRGAVLQFAINRPEKRNAINHEVIDGLTKGLKAAADDPGVRAVVITGVGEKAFCAGGDMQAGGGFSFDYERPQAPFADLLRAAHGCPLPIVARVNGACLAGGMGLLCMADLAVAADSATFGLPEVKVGLFPFQVLALLRDLVPARTINEWCMCGEPFDAETARVSGLVNHVVPADRLDEKVDWLLGRIVDKSLTAIRRGKYAIRAMAQMNFAASIAFAESQLPLMALSSDAKEGLAAFNAKRKPRWAGQ